MRSLFYLLLMAFLRLVTRIFFRRVEVSGREHVPVSGPVVLVGNHPNSLLDPVMIATTCGRHVRMAAKQTLFAGPLRPLLWAVGAVAVKRRQDQVEGAAEDAVVVGAPARVDNSAAFEALTAILKAGDAFAIFPEGISHTRSELAGPGEQRMRRRAPAWPPPPTTPAPPTPRSRPGRHRRRLAAATRPARP